MARRGYRGGGTNKSIIIIHRPTKSDWTTIPRSNTSALLLHRQPNPSTLLLACRPSPSPSALCSIKHKYLPTLARSATSSSPRSTQSRVRAVYSTTSGACSQSRVTIYHRPLCCKLPTSYLNQHIHFTTELSRWITPWRILRTPLPESLRCTRRLSCLLLPSATVLRASPNGKLPLSSPVYVVKPFPSIRILPSSEISSSALKPHCTNKTLSSLQQELLSLMTSTPPGISAFPSATSLLNWTATLTGPSDTPYENLTFKLSLEFPNNYPYAAPLVLFKTPIYHPNVDFSGRICLDILKDKWSASMSVQSVLLSLQSLLGEPNK